MNIEKQPYFISRKFYGSIVLPEIETVLKDPDGSIPFCIEVTKETIYGTVTQGNCSIGFDRHYHIHCLLKDINYKRVSGKKLRYITEQILKEIKEKNIVL